MKNVCEKGASLIEYTLLSSIIALVSIASIGYSGTEARGTIQTSGCAMRINGVTADGRINRDLGVGGFSPGATRCAHSDAGKPDKGSGDDKGDDSGDK